MTLAKRQHGRNRIAPILFIPLMIGRGFSGAFGTSNPFEISRIESDNPFSANYSSASENGLIIGSIVAGGVFGGSGGYFGSSSQLRVTPNNFSNCFVAGTLIHTENGVVPIEKIKTGDNVLSYNEESRQLEYQEVVRLFRNTADEFLKIRVEGESEPITVTLGHPFYVHRNRSGLPANSDDGGDWVLSKSLRVGDLLKSKNGEWKPILSIEKLVETQTTYNFEVAKNHDYFVGLIGWLVHNQSVRPYEVGIFDDLQSRSVVGDGLDLHHVVQKQPASQVIPGYNPQNAPSIALPQVEHRLIPNLRGAFNGTPRQILARDVRNLRNFTNTPRSSIRELIELNREMYPNVFR